jgi:hypothetical protein
MALLLLKWKVKFAHVIKNETVRDDANQFPQTVPQYLHVARTAWLPYIFVIIKSKYCTPEM